jgi:hypothetical protein
MKRFLTILVVTLFSSAFAFAQQTVTQDDDAATVIQVGYGVVTPVTVGTSGTTEGLVVFETFGVRGENGTTQAGVLPPGLTTNALLFVDSSGRLGKNLGVAIVNPNSSNANVSLTLRKSDGTSVGTTTLNVPSHQQVSEFVTQLFAGQTSVPLDITGSLAITSAGSSNLPVSVIGLRFRGVNFSTLPITNLSGNTGTLPEIASGVGGDGAVLLPQFAAGGGWATELVLLNSGTEKLTVRVDLFTPAGKPLTTTLNGQTGSSFQNIVIPPGGVVTLAPRDRDGDDDF